MDLFVTLMKLRERLWKLKMAKSKDVYLTVPEIREKMINNEPMPTNIFNATKTDYIVKPTTIHGPRLTKKR